VKPKTIYGMKFTDTNMPSKKHVLPFKHSIFCSLANSSNT